jgi:hypothetical protein
MHFGDAVGLDLFTKSVQSVSQPGIEWSDSEVRQGSRHIAT